MEVRTCKRCGRCFAWDRGPLDWLNQCPRCSGQILPKDHLAEWIVRGCLVLGSVLSAWLLVSVFKSILSFFGAP